MLQFFRNHQVSTSVFVALYALIFLANRFLPSADAASVASSALLRGVYGLGQGWPSVVQTLFWAALLLAQAFYLNSLVNRTRLVKRPSFVVAIAVILLTHGIAGLDAAGEGWLAGFCLMFSLGNLLALSEKRAGLAEPFNAGFWLGMAALCYAPCILLLGWLLLGLVRLRAWEPRVGILLVCGALVPLFWMGTYQLLQDNFGGWLSGEFGFRFGLPHWAKAPTVLDWLGLGMLGALGLLIFLNVQSLYFKTTLQEQESLNSIFLLLFASGLLLFASVGGLSPNSLALLVLPLAILVGIWWQAMRSAVLGELLHLVAVLVFLAVQYQSALVR